MKRIGDGMKQAKLLLGMSMLSLLATPMYASAETYDIDPSHATAGFSIRHLMVSNVKGLFSNVKGTVEYDPKNVAASKVEASVDAATIDTREAKRDAHLKGPEFFDVTKFPEFKFTSTKVEPAASGLTVTGDLTIRGITKTVVLNVEGPSDEIKDPWGNVKRGASATTKLNRKDFGLTWNKVLEAGGVAVGDEVTVTIELELTKKVEKKS